MREGFLVLAGVAWAQAAAAKYGRDPFEITTSTTTRVYHTTTSRFEASSMGIVRRWEWEGVFDAISRAFGAGPPSSPPVAPGTMPSETPLLAFSPTVPGQGGVPGVPLTTTGGGLGDIAAGPCKSYAIVSARGTGESQVDPNGSRGIISTVLANVPDGESYEVVYPASSNFLTDPEVGAGDVVRHVTALLEKCPNEKLVYFGYSQGAMVIINAMNGPFLKSRTLNVKAAVFYGNPYRHDGQVQNRGTARGGTGVGTLKNVYEFGNDVPPELVPVTRDFCNQGDPVCQGITQLKITDITSTLVNDGTAFAAHHYNGTPQEVEATVFVIQQLRS